MEVVKKTRSLRELAHWIAVVIGIVVGLVLFGYGLALLFVANSRDIWFGIITVAVGTLTLLPLSVLGIFKPRAAAYGVLACTLEVLVYLVIDAIQSREEPSVHGEGFAFFLVPIAIAGLLFWASGHEGETATNPERRSG